MREQSKQQLDPQEMITLAEAYLGYRPLSDRGSRKLMRILGIGVIGALIGAMVVRTVNAPTIYSNEIHLAPPIPAPTVVGSLHGPLPDSTKMPTQPLSK